MRKRAEEEERAMTARVYVSVYIFGRWTECVCICIQWYGNLCTVVFYSIYTKGEVTLSWQRNREKDRMKERKRKRPPIAITYAGAIMWGGLNMNISVYKLHKLNNSLKLTDTHWRNIFRNEGNKLRFSGGLNVCDGACAHVWVCLFVCVEKKHAYNERDAFCIEIISKMLVAWFVQCIQTHTCLYIFHVFE